MRRRMVIWVMTLAVLGGWAGCGSQEHEDGEELARIGSVVFRESDLEERLQAMPALSRSQFEGARGRRNLLERMIEEEAFFQAAEAEGFDKNPQVVEEVDGARRLAMLRTYYEEEILEKARPTSEEVEEYYRTHLEEFRTDPRVRVAHVLTKTEAEAERVRELAEMGRDFETLVANYSIDGKTKESGGIIPGFLSRGQQVPLFGQVSALVDAAVLLTEEQQISPVVRTELGYHVLKALEVNPGGLVPLDDVRQRISDRETEMRSKELYDLKVIELSKRFKVKFAEQNEALSVQDLFDKAQNSRSPAERIKAYEQILQMYPDDPRAYEAQFMIGFTYSEEMNNDESARAAFQAVIRRYPDSELAESAKWMLENLGQEDIPMEDIQLPAGARGERGSN